MATAGCGRRPRRANHSHQELLTANESAYGAYLHERFTAFFNGGGMEYEGGTTTATSALAHEAFHSWFARGVKPASQADGWWDEGFTVFHDDGANDATPFDYTRAPILLCSRDPWQRHTPGNAYSDGSAFWKGVAAMLGVANLNTLMGELYDTYRGASPLSTAMIEEFLLRRSGDAQLVGAFHRFAYGLPDATPTPQLWLKDAAADPGADSWSGAFWNSPDLWVRNDDDGGQTHQAPEYGQDNWFHARVRNATGAGVAQHLVVTFQAKPFAGTEFVYPNDFLPCIAATAVFDLAPGATRIVAAHWPRAQVPPAGTHTCLLASVLSRSDLPVAGRHVWEHNNLAQKNLTVVDLLPDGFVIVPIVIGNWLPGDDPRVQLEVWRRNGALRLDASVLHPEAGFFRHANVPVAAFGAPAGEHPRGLSGRTLLDCGGALPAFGALGGAATSDAPGLVERRFPRGWEATFGPEDRSRLTVHLPPPGQAVVGLKVRVPRQAKPGSDAMVHLVQREALTDRIVGGIAVRVTVRARRVHEQTTVAAASVTGLATSVAHLDRT